MSLHELCAAKHFISLPEEQQSSIVDDILMGKVRRMASMLSFYSAFGGWMLTKSKQVLIKHAQENFYLEGNDKGHHAVKRQSDDKEFNPDSMVLNSVYESQTPELCEMLPPNLVLLGLTPTTRDCIALRYIISHRRLEQLELNDLNFVSFKMIVPGLRLNMPNDLALIRADI